MSAYFKSGLRSVAGSLFVAARAPIVTPEEAPSFDEIKVGEQVSVTLTRALAISIDQE